MLEGIPGVLSAALAVQPSAAPEGVIASGWPYAIAAYTITGLGLAIYAWSLARRLREANKEEHKS